MSMPLSMHSLQPPPPIMTQRGRRALDCLRTHPSHRFGASRIWLQHVARVPWESLVPGHSLSSSWHGITASGKSRKVPPRCNLSHSCLACSLASCICLVALVFTSAAGSRPECSHDEMRLICFWLLRCCIVAHLWHAVH